MRSYLYCKKCERFVGEAIDVIYCSCISPANKNFRNWNTFNKSKGEVPKDCKYYLEYLVGEKIMFKSELAINRDELKPTAKFPVYPPYHTGYYLEEYFYHKWLDAGITSERKYIDIFWTNLWLNNHHVGDEIPDIQSIIDEKLDPNGKYFTITEPHENIKLPKDTLVFNSGSNREAYKSISVPLVCSMIPDVTEKPKDIFCSFVGARTHELREQLFETYKNDSDFVFSQCEWSAKVSQERWELFKDITSRSKFVLCPRGTGRTSWRLYEAMQLGAIPVYVSDEYMLPWDDILNWKEFCVLISEKEIPDLKEILLEISDKKYDEMQKFIKSIYNNCFSLDGVFVNIVVRLEYKVI